MAYLVSPLQANWSQSCENRVSILFLPWQNMQMSVS